MPGSGTSCGMKGRPGQTTSSAHRSGDDGWPTPTHRPSGTSWPRPCFLVATRRGSPDAGQTLGGLRSDLKLKRFPLAAIHCSAVSAEGASVLSVFCTVAHNVQLLSISLELARRASQSRRVQYFAFDTVCFQRIDAPSAEPLQRGARPALPTDVKSYNLCNSLRKCSEALRGLAPRAETLQRRLGCRCKGAQGNVNLSRELRLLASHLSPLSHRSDKVKFPQKAKPQRCLTHTKR